MQTSWLSPGTEKEMMKGISDFIFLLTSFIKTTAWAGKKSADALETQVVCFWFFFLITPFTLLMELASVHHHFKR